MKTMNFAAQVADWVHEVEGAIEAIYTDSVQDLLEEAQKNAPVKTGFLVNSLLLSTTAMPAIKETEKPADGAKYAPAEISASIIGEGFGSVLYAGYTAAYAARLEFGFEGVDTLGRVYRQSPRMFVGLAAQNWPNIVQRNAQRLSAKIAFR
ncbi:HK97 gp10 family phage protein [Jiella avicenniae]|uniref:HK97 gp10 family phage protein n=1 Tax=Jiella avicenniae TaxID=2907202 RepID=A0A9X1P351_9HYPH|nr:HK97 gp10 family phage protein [Jiella avicenniae]MCE7028473.1 HK97 gp10 family phage protein [Jiella avicenniae]